jgi:hypothetical protein
LVGLVAVAAAGCGQTAGAKTIRGQSLPSPQADITFKGGQLVLGPTSAKSAVSADVAVAAMRTNPLVSKLIAEGFVPTFQFAAFTNKGYGSPLAGLTPDEAAAVKTHPQPDGATLHLFYDRTPAWTARFTIPASSNPIPYLGPPGRGTAAVSNAPVMVLLVFSADGAETLQALSFPT